MYHNFCNCHGNDCGTGRIIRPEPDDLLLTTIPFRLTMGVLVGFGLSRRKTVRKVEDIFCWQCRKTLQNADGTPFIMPEFEKFFPDDDSCRWFGRLIEIYEKKIDLSKPCYNTKRFRDRYIPVLGSFNIAAKIENPEPFRAIGQIC